MIFTTDRAVFFQDHFWHAPEFLPKSQITITYDYDSDEIRLDVAEWLVRKNEWAEFKELYNGDE